MQVTRNSPADINVYTNGSWNNPTRPDLGLGGSGIWWPGCSIQRNDNDSLICLPISDAEFELGHFIQTSTGLQVCARIGGFSGNPLVLKWLLVFLQSVPMGLSILALTVRPLSHVRMLLLVMLPGAETHLKKEDAASSLVMEISGVTFTLSSSPRTQGYPNVLGPGTCYL